MTYVLSLWDESAGVVIDKASFFADNSTLVHVDTALRRYSAIPFGSFFPDLFADYSYYTGLIIASQCI